MGRALGPLWAPWALMGPLGPMGQALMNGIPWALMGQALMGRALMGRALMPPPVQFFFSFSPSFFAVCCILGPIRARPMRAQGAQ